LGWRDAVDGKSCGKNGDSEDGDVLHCRIIYIVKQVEICKFTW
jgi:hypothetical protein